MKIKKIFQKCFDPLLFTALPVEWTLEDVNYNSDGNRIVDTQTTTSGVSDWILNGTCDSKVHKSI